MTPSAGLEASSFSRLSEDAQPRVMFNWWYDWQDSGGGYSSDDQSQQDEALCDSTQVDEIVSNLMYEIQGLQHELNGMVCTEEPKLKVQFFYFLLLSVDFPHLTLQGTY